MMLHIIYFSAKGTTEMCAGCIGQGLNLQMKPYNWFEKPCNELLEISSEDVLLFSMPVYGGFIPQSCAKMAKNLKGNNTSAIIAAVYGNRHYDDALLQMKDILTEQGFYVIAAGAFIAEHSVFPSVASGRPDDKDKAAMKAFAAKCCQLLSIRGLKNYKEISLPGTQGYDGFSYEEYHSSRTVMINVLLVENVVEFVPKMQLVREILERQIMNCVLPVVPA